MARTTPVPAHGPRRPQHTDCRKVRLSLRCFRRSTAGWRVGPWSWDSGAKFSSSCVSCLCSYSASRSSTSWQTETTCGWTGGWPWRSGTWTWFDSTSSPSGTWPAGRCRLPPGTSGETSARWGQPDRMFLHLATPVIWDRWFYVSPPQSVQHAGLTEVRPSGCSGDRGSSFRGRLFQTQQYLSRG